MNGLKWILILTKIEEMGQKFALDDLSARYVHSTYVPKHQTHSNIVAITHHYDIFCTCVRGGTICQKLGAQLTLQPQKVGEQNL